MARTKEERLLTSSAADGIVTFNWRDGAVDTFDSADLPDDIKEALLEHGIKQKVRDSFSGKEVSLELAKGRAADTWAKLVAGDFNEKREGVSREEPIDLLCDGLCRVLSQSGQAYDRAAVMAQLAGMNRTARNEVRRVPEVGKAIIDIKAEKKGAPSGVAALAAKFASQQA